MRSMVDVIGGCVICAQNLCINNFSSLPCGHTFHYKCVERWLHLASRLQRIQRCPTCRAYASPMNIVKRLYFANCNDQAVNGVGTSAAAYTTNGNAPSSQMLENMDEFDGSYHDSDESYNNNSGYNSDSEEGANQTGSDSTASDTDATLSGDSDFIMGSEEESEEELEYQITVNDAEHNIVEIVSLVYCYRIISHEHALISILEEISSDMVNVLDASFNVTSSDSLGTFSVSISEIDDTMSVSSLGYDNMETSESLDSLEEVGADNDDVRTAVIIEREDDDDSSSSDDSDDSNDFLDHIVPHLLVFNQFVFPKSVHASYLACGSHMRCYAIASKPQGILFPNMALDLKHETLFQFRKVKPCPIHIQKTVRDGLQILVISIAFGNCCLQS
uniref:RING-type domain-containing protein n=1 Tax=Elaeophora elaphi TaxID=1147741 RepID=A0A0R3RGU0_9BILA